jgi:hypothetical protein
LDEELVFPVQLPLSTRCPEAEVAEAETPAAGMIDKAAPTTPRIAVFRRMPALAYWPSRLSNSVTDGGALAHAGCCGQGADRGEELPDGRRGQFGDLAVAVRGELEEIAAVGAQGVRGGARVLAVGEEVVEVAGEPMVLAEVFDDHRIHVFTLPCAELPDNWQSNAPSWRDDSLLSWPFDLGLAR